MKRQLILKCLMVFAVFFTSETVFCYGFHNNNNLIYNTEEQNGQVVSETVYKKDGTTLINFERHNYKYDVNNQKIEDESQKWNSDLNQWENDICMHYDYKGNCVTTTYYKWQDNKKGYVLIPSMTITMNK